MTVLLHDNDFSDLSACTFWLPPQLPLAPYYLRTFATKPWANATLSVYPGTVGPDEWIRFTDAVLQLTPGTTPLGTECLEPGADVALLQMRGVDISNRARIESRRTPRATPGPAPASFNEPIISAYATQSGRHTIWQQRLDLGAMSNPAFSFESSLEGSGIRGVAQVSLDGAHWRTIARLRPSSTWTTIELNLSEFAGHNVQVRLVLDTDQPPAESASNRWRIRSLRLNR